jgi:hypothetical protein
VYEYYSEGGPTLLLCLGIIEDALGKRALYKNYDKEDDPFVLERPEIYRRGAVFATGVLYLARATSLHGDFLAQEGSAIICIGMPPEAYLDCPVRVIALDEATDMEELSNDINRIFFEYNTLEQKLQDSVNKGRSVQHMVEILAPYLNGNELMIINSDFRLIAKSNHSLHLNEISGLGQPDEQGFLPPDIVTFFKNDFSKVRNLTEPFFYEASIFAKRALCKNVFFRGEYVCRIILPEDASPFRGYEPGLLKFFSSFIQLVYDLSSSGSGILPTDSMADVYIDLLKGETVEKWRLQNCFERRSWPLDGPFHCAVLMPSDRDFYNRTIRYYCQTFNRDIEGCCFVEFGGEIVCVINIGCYGGLLDNFISEHLEIFRDAYFRIGYSNCFSNIEDLQHYFLQAKIALRTGLNQRPFQWHYRFADFVLSYMASKLTEELDGRFLCAPEILLLGEYDKTHGSELLPTLKVYLRNNMNAVKTAKELFIHRSTMVYRLERIEELTGIDYKDPYKILHLLISLELLLKD